MQKVFVAVAVAAALLTARPFAQAPAPAAAPAAPVSLEAVAKALGASKGLTQIQFSATGSNNAYGQAWKADMPWPAFKIYSYTATVDYAVPAMRIDLQRTNPDATPVRGGGGLPLLAPQQQIQAISGKVAWNLVPSATGGAPAVQPQPAAVADRTLYLWTLTPQGVIKAAMANNATIAGRFISFKIGDTAVKATVGANNLIASVRTVGDAAVLGDVTTETTFSNYEETKGVKFPMRIVQKQGGFPILDLTVATVRPQSNVTIDIPSVAAAAAATATPTPAALRVDTQKVADGIYYLTGGSHHSVAVEFKDYVVLIEAPQTDERAVAVFDAVKKQIPNKPIRYVVNSHNHFDHLGGVRAAMAEGYTIVTHASNVAYYQRIAAMPHTVSPDRLSKSPKKPVIEGVVDKRVFSDDTNTLELYRVSTDHNDAMLVAYLPKAKLLVEADMWNPPAANAPPAAAINPVTVQLVDSIKKLNLDVQQIAGLHGRLATIQELRAAAGQSS
jgi:glyoxylase-like metal-dependent hydrolase (beta-lactamase superfamily II)